MNKNFFFNFAPNPIEIKLIPRQIKDNRIYYRFGVKVGSVVTKMLTQKKDSIKIFKCYRWINWQNFILFLFLI